MKFKITSLLCLFLAIACSTEEIEIAETTTADTVTVTLNQKIVDQLNEDGFEAIVTNEGKVASVGFKTPQDFILKLNSIFDNLNESNHKIDVNALNSQSDATRNVQCEMGEIDEDNCVTFVCWGPELESISMGSAGDDHYVYWTSC
jgi:hypothetical protein